MISPALFCNPWLSEKPSENNEEPHLNSELKPAGTPCCAFELVLLRVGSWRAQHDQLLGKRTMDFLHFLILVTNMLSCNEEEMLPGSRESEVTTAPPSPSGVPPKDTALLNCTAES